MYKRSNGYVDLSPILKQKMGGKHRVQGRYNSSELYFLTNGKTTPEEWLNPPDRKMVELLRMWKGIMAHNLIQELLKKEWSEIKREHKWNGITLVGKADYLPPEFPDEVWEFKSSEKLMEDSRPYHEYQTKLYCTMFEKEKGVVMQPVENEDGIFLKELGTVERDDEWFKKELEKLFAFHLSVEALWNLRNK